MAWNVGDNTLTTLYEKESLIVSAEISDKGTQFAVWTAVDNTLTIVDAISGNPVASTKIEHNSPRAGNVFWLGDKYIGTSGFGRGSVRQMSIFDVNSLSQGAVCTVDLESSPSLGQAVFDRDTSILYFAGRGDNQIRTFDFNENDKSLTEISVFVAQNSCLGFSLAPKQEVDVRKVEIAKLFYLSDKLISSVGFSIPRQRVRK